MNSKDLRERADTLNEELADLTLRSYEQWLQINRPEEPLDPAARSALRIERDKVERQIQTAKDELELVERASSYANRVNAGAVWSTLAEIGRSVETMKEREAPEPEPTEPDPIEPTNPTEAEEAAADAASKPRRGRRIKPA